MADNENEAGGTGCESLPFQPPPQSESEPTASDYKALREYMDALNAVGLTSDRYEDYEEVERRSARFYLSLTPARVRKLLPERELTHDEERALQYSVEERAILRSKTATAEEKEAVREARRDRAADFLYRHLTFEELTRLLSRATTSPYSIFRPNPADIHDGYASVPTTQLYINTTRLLNIADILEAASRINKRSHKQKASVITTTEGVAVLETKSNTTRTQVAIPQALDLAFTKENGAKMLDFFMGKIYRTAYDAEKKTLKNREIVITDEELTALKVCGTDNLKVTQRNFRAFETYLFNYAGGSVTKKPYQSRKGKQSTETVLKLQRILTEMVIHERGGIHRFKLSPDFAWADTMEYYTLLPDGYYQLSRRGALLLKMTLNRARMTAADRKTPAELLLPLADIAYELQLPTDTKKAKHEIKDPIDAIIAEINELIPAVTLTLEADPAAPIRDYMTGNIRATFSGELLTHYEALKETKPQRIQAAIARRQRAADAQLQREANAKAATKQKAKK